MRDYEARFKYPSVCFGICLNVYFTFSTRLASLKVDEILSMEAKETLNVEIRLVKSECLAFRLKRNLPVSQPQHMLG